MANAIYSNARAKYQENFLLGKERIFRLAECESFLDAVKILAEVNFAGGIYETADCEFEKIISADRQKFIDFIKETCPSECFKSYLLIPNDYHNAEAFLRAKHLKIDPYKMTTLEGLIGLDRLKDKIFSDDYKDFSPALTGALLKAEEKLALGNRSGAEISLIFKKALYSELYVLAMKDPVVKEIYTAKADYINVSLSLRLRDYKKAKEQFVQGGTILESGLKTLCEEGKETLKEKAKTITSKLDILLAVNAFADNMPFSEFERVSEGYAVRLLSKRKYEQSGIIPFINYCFMKETEYRNVRIALAGIINGMDKADIKRRLRDTYEG